MRNPGQSSNNPIHNFLDSNKLAPMHCYEAKKLDNSELNNLYIKNNMYNKPSITSNFSQNQNNFITSFNEVNSSSAVPMDKTYIKIKNASRPVIPPLSITALKPNFPQTSKLKNINLNDFESTVRPIAEEYHIGDVIGNGSFGVVFEAVCNTTNELVAIKKVLQDSRYKNRELDVLKELSHPNIVKLIDYFYTKDTQSQDMSTNTSTHATSNGLAASNHVTYNVHKSQTGLLKNKEPNREEDFESPSSSIYLNVVMEHVPDTVYKIIKSYNKKNEHVPLPLIRLYMYQLLRGIGYFHSLGFCHRDIKPQNLLVNSKTHVLKLCDFGSAKKLIKNEQSVAYICSRFYRAPELLLEATEYTTAVDLWSIGCVLGELLLGRPIFSGKTSLDQLVQIIQILGTPNKSEIAAMNPKINFVFPYVKPSPWKKLFQDSPNVTKEVLQVLNALLAYDPKKRVKPYDLLSYPFFEPLYRKPPTNSNFPPLFNFTDYEVKLLGKKQISKLIPQWLQFNNL